MRVNAYADVLPLETIVSATRLAHGEIKPFLPAKTRQKPKIGNFPYANIGNFTYEFALKMENLVKKFEFHLTPGVIRDIV